VPDRLVGGGVPVLLQARQARVRPLVLAWAWALAPAAPAAVAVVLATVSRPAVQRRRVRCCWSRLLKLQSWILLLLLLPKSILALAVPPPLRSPPPLPPPPSLPSLLLTTTTMMMMVFRLLPPPPPRRLRLLPRRLASERYQSAFVQSPQRSDSLQERRTNRAKTLPLHGAAESSACLRARTIAKDARGGAALHHQSRPHQWRRCRRSAQLCSCTSASLRTYSRRSRLT